MSHNPHPPTPDEKKAMQASLVAELEPLLAEELVAAQWFYAGGRWSSLTMTARTARLLTGRRRIDDGLARTNVLAVTPTRVLVFEIDPRPDGQLADPAAFTWPRAAVSGTVRKITLSDSDDGGLLDDEEYIDVRRATLRTPDGVLVADLPSGDRTSLRLITALDLETGKGTWQRFVGRLSRG